MGAQATTLITLRAVTLLTHYCLELIKKLFQRTGRTHRAPQLLLCPAIAPTRPIRLRHRKTDVLRRQREASAVKRLQQLTEEQRQGQDGNTAATRERDKASVLHDAADELLRLRAELAAARAREEAQWRRADRLAGIAGIRWLDERHTLHGMLLLHTRMCLMLVSKSGLLLDISERVVELTGWQPQRLKGSTVGREDGPHIEVNEACPLWVRALPTTSSQSRSFYRLPQYAASKRQLNAVFEGHEKRAEVPFRMWLASGRIVEAPCTAWQTDFGVRGEQNELAHHVVMMWPMDDCLEVPALVL